MFDLKSLTQPEVDVVPGPPPKFIHKPIQHLKDVLHNDQTVDLTYAINESARRLGFDRAVTIESLDYPNYRMTDNVEPHFQPLFRSMTSGSDWMGFTCGSTWLWDVPRIAVPTDEQAESFANISIDLPVTDFSMPFPCIAVELKHNPYFNACIVHQYSPTILVTSLARRIQRPGHPEDYDITTAMSQHGGETIEDSLGKLHEDDMQSILPWSRAGQRIALNMCLSLVNYGFESGPLFPKVEVQDRVWAKEDSERGKRARERLTRTLHRVSFTRQVVIRKPSVRQDGELTGKTVAPHWVRGHWKSQPHGPRGSLRKRILIQPYLVHGERIQEVPSQLTRYEDRRR